MSKPTIKALLALLLCTVVYHWKILLTHDYSLLVAYEGLCQGYGWLQFWILSIRDGALPLWDPFALAGHPFAGEMQTAAFYPLNLVLVLFPFNQQGVFSPQLFHQWFALMHFLGGCFMFALARELGLRRFPALIAGICFSLGGLTGAVAWPDMVNSAIWLPLVFLFLLRALRAETTKRAALNASLGGLSLGTAILAGRLHMPVMQAVCVVGAAVFASLHPQLRQKRSPGKPWLRPATVLGVLAGVAFCAGAVQLLLSMEYSRHALRFFGSMPALPATTRIPSTYPAEGLAPHGLWGILFAFGFSGQLGGHEVLRFYLGVFPLLAAVIGVWKRWSTPWVQYLSGLAVVAFLYALGEFSAVYGLLRTVVPYLWMVREANRFMYLADFSLAILAAFGVEALFYGPVDEPAWRPLSRMLAWIVAACAVAQAIPALFDRPGINPWNSLSILLIFGAFGLYRFIIRGHTGVAVQSVMVALILFDLTGFNWTASSVPEATQAGSNALQNVLDCRGAVDFLKSLPGRYRVQIAGNDAPPIGDLYQVPTVNGGMRATLLLDYFAFMGHADLLNARYLLKPVSSPEPGDLYHDSKWKVYENPKAYPPAWIVHEAIVEPSAERLWVRLDSPEVDLHRQALVDAPLPAVLEPPVEEASEDVRFEAGGRNPLELTVHARSRGLVVLSEMFYPGWHATVNGEDAPIYKVDGALRGIVVPRGESRVVLRYFPWSFRIGAFLTVAAFLGTLLGVFLEWRKSRQEVVR